MDVWFAAAVFAFFAGIAFIGCALVTFRQWLALKRVCSWCKVSMGGNPLARRTTHGICPHCLAEKKREIAQVVPIRFVTQTGTNSI